MESYQKYIRCIWESAQRGYELSSSAMKVMNDLVFYVFANIASKACHVLEKERKVIMDIHAIQEACVLILPDHRGVRISNVAAQAQLFPPFGGGPYCFPAKVIHRYLKDGQLGTKKYRWENGLFEQYETKVSPLAAVALAAVLHHITSRILKASVKQIQTHMKTKIVDTEHIARTLNMQKDLGIFAARNGRSVPQAGPPPGPQVYQSLFNEKSPSNGGRTVVINSLMDMETYVSQNAGTIQRILLENYSRAKFLKTFHPDKCISGVESLIDLFAKLGKQLELNIVGTHACDIIFKKFLHIFL